MKIKVLWHKGTQRHYVLCPVGFDGNTKQRPKYFDTKSAAADFAKVVNNWRYARKMPKIDSGITISETDTVLVAICRERNVRSGQLLNEIITHWERTGRMAITQISLRDAVQKFIDHVETEEKPRPAYLADIIGKLNRFSAEFPGEMAHEFDRAGIREYLADWENPASRNQQLKRLSKFFDWARKERFVAIDPTEDIDFSKVDQKENIDIYSVDETTRLVRTADTNHKAVAPWFILGAFGFMRSSEIQRVDWSAFNFEKRSITLPARITHNGKRRVPEINDTLLHWLAPYRKESGPVVQNLNGSVNRCFKEANVQRLHNALRHSCESYAVKGTDMGLDEVFLQAGHTPSVAMKHYIESMTRAEALPYWCIRRQADTPESLTK
jgi:integrase